MIVPSLTYKQIKWIILLLPTVTVGLWEFIRHTSFMLEHLSMEAGNWLTPVIVFAVTILFMRKLFQLMEDMHKKLEEEKTRKAMFEERENIARQLHDGIAQSLFLLSVKMKQIEAAESRLKSQKSYQQMQKIVQHMHDDVRQSIFNYRNPNSINPFPWTESMHLLIHDYQKESGLSVAFNWEIPEDQLSAKDKIELYACVKEALMNIRKHAKANQILVKGQQLIDGWVCMIEDDGQGFTKEELQKNKGYGLEIMQDRARERGWKIEWSRDKNSTKVFIQKRGGG